MKVFNLVRAVDHSGISGTGVVAQGVVFSDGLVALRWCSRGRPSSLVIWDSIEDVIEIHGHDGATVVEYL